MIKTFTALVAALISLLALTACAEDQPAYETHTAANGDKFNDPDVKFASNMISTTRRRCRWWT